MKRYRWLCACLAVLLLCTGCQSNGGEAPQQSRSSEEPTGEPPAPDRLQFAADGRSDYVLVYDSGEPNARSLATDVSELLYQSTGALIQTVDVGTKPAEYQKEIVIGNARMDVAETFGLSDSDFLVGTYEDDLILYATDEEMYRYLAYYLKQELLAALPDRSFSLPRATRLAYADGSCGARYLTLFNGGSTDLGIRDGALQSLRRQSPAQKRRFSDHARRA